jgi:hypothetical protein
MLPTSRREVAMQRIFTPSKPDSSAAALAAQQLAESQARAQREQEELDRRERSEAEARRRGLRGVGALLSEAGGFLGFKNTLGG